VFIYGEPRERYRIAKYSALAFSRLGLKFETVNLADPRVAEILNPLLATRLSDVLCFVSPNYAAANIRVGGQLLRSATGVPLVFYFDGSSGILPNLQIPNLKEP